MDKSPDAFRTISEVAEWLGVQAHVLRFWESKFAQVKPVKRAGGRRYYRPADMLLLGGIKKLLHEDGLTVKGTQKILREQGVAHVSDLSQELCDVAADTAQKMAEDAKVVPFKGDPGPAKDPAPAEIKDVSPPEVAVPPAAPSVVPPVAPAAEVEPARPEIPAKAATGAEPQEKPEEEQPILPSFLHRPTAVSPPKSPPEMPPETPTETPAEAPPELPLESPPEAPPEAVAEAKPSLVVEAPDPADESDIPYTRGTLAHLSQVQSLNAAQAARIAPLAKELQGWLDRMSGVGAS